MRPMARRTLSLVRFSMSGRQSARQNRFLHSRCFSMLSDERVSRSAATIEREREKGIMFLCAVPIRAHTRAST